MTEPILVSSFYSLQPLHPDELAPLQQELQQWADLRGLVLLAPDGVNATVAGDPQRVSLLEGSLQQRWPLSTLKHSYCSQLPFGRWKVQIRRETITSGPMAQPQRQAPRLSPSQWQARLQDPEVVVIDVRNDYEIALGRFRGAIDPQTQTFSQFADFVAQSDLPKDRPILTYCTGGIRCEKAAPYLLEQGFQEVYHLDGGILNYLAHFPDQLFEGECFVFDERVALDQQLQPTHNFSRCPQCGQPCPLGATHC